MRPGVSHHCERSVVCAGDIDPDAAIVPADVLSRQALEGQAEDLALEDALYSLDKALQANVLQPDAYIKQARWTLRARTAFCCEV